jgi:preprotein translocase subunit Sec63
MTKLTRQEAADLLGVSVDCTDEGEINKAFRKASLKCHPDKAVHLPEEEQAEAGTSHGSLHARAPGPRLSVGF